MFYANRGMYLEYLIENTAKYYKLNGLCLIYKRNIPISIIKNFNNGLVEAKLKQKSLSDYYGCYQRLMFDFEAKQTNKLDFSDELIKKHQKIHLIECYEKFQIHAFLIIHFVHYDKFFAIHIKNYLEKIKQKKTIDYNWFEANAFELKIVFPGILDIISYLNYLERNTNG